MKKLLFLLILLTPIICDAQFYGLNQNYDQVKFGYLYNWYAADYSSGDTITSSNDWSIPTETQWSDLLIHGGGTGVFGLGDNKGLKFQKTSSVVWNTASGTDDYGLSLVGGGSRSQTTGAFTNSKLKGVHMGYGSDYVFIDFSDNSNVVQKLAKTTRGVSIRLVKDATGISDGVTTTYVGNNGFVYTAIAINELYWITSNLVETKFRDGSWITGFDGGAYTPISNANWASKTSEAMCAYNDDVSNVFF
jgi:uncharacterized protein (TIGR02145 family)